MSYIIKEYTIYPQFLSLSSTMWGWAKHEDISPINTFTHGLKLKLQIYILIFCLLNKV